MAQVHSIPTLLLDVRLDSINILEMHVNTIYPYTTNVNSYRVAAASWTAK